MPTDAQYLLNEIYDCRLEKREETVERYLERYRTLMLEMGRVIRSLDEDGKHSEFWTQDSDYIIDGRFPR